ncbi:MAG: hypothetical protein M1305_05465 [Candidatus Marsarchaeota archaeon]|nr:hypothetical protein [Candidatus Marsarchaeota archaeon]
MYLTGDPVWDPDSGTWKPIDGWWPIGTLPLSSMEQPGDPWDLTYHEDYRIGVRERVCDIPLGTYEIAEGAMLGHVIHAIDFTISAAAPDGWLSSQNLLVELRGPYADSDIVYWSAKGPFTSEPVHAYIEFPQPTAGYQVRLTVVPDASSLITLLTGIGFLAIKIMRRPA